MGEATSDYLVFHMNPYLAVALGSVGLLGALLLQVVVRRYIPWIYWLAVVMVAIFGTMAADVAHVVLGVPYLASSAAFAIVLVAVFSLWFRSEKTLDIHSIRNRRRELFYWATVLATFALGTATGDMTASTLHLGYLASGLLFTVLFALPGFLYRVFKANDVFAFWFAYVMTRPLGASFADWFGMPHSYGGLGYGRGPISLILTVLIVILVGYVSLTERNGRRSSGSSAGLALRAQDRSLDHAEPSLVDGIPND